MTTLEDIAAQFGVAMAETRKRLLGVI